MCVCIHIIDFIISVHIFFLEDLNTITSRQFNEIELIYLLSSCFFPPLPTFLSPGGTEC